MKTINWRRAETEVLSQRAKEFVPQVNEWKGSYAAEETSFQSVSLWVEHKLAMLPNEPRANTERLAGVCELLWLLTERFVCMDVRFRVCN